MDYRQLAVIKEQQLKQKVFDLCEENNIHYTDLLKYIIFTELNYNAITIEDDEEHARDIYGLLLGDCYEEN